MRCKRRNINSSAIGLCSNKQDGQSYQYDFARDVSLEPVVTGLAHCMLARKLRTPFAKHIDKNKGFIFLLLKRWGSKQPKPSAKLMSYCRLIPYVSFISLLLLSVCVINPNSSEITYALESGNDGNAGNISQLAYFGNILDLRRSLLAPDSLNNEFTLGNDLSPSDLSLLADTATTYADNSLSMSIGGADVNGSVTTFPGQIAYRAHTVTVTSSNMKNYTLTINGPVGLSGGSTFTGAGGKTPANMTDNTWGVLFHNPR